MLVPFVFICVLTVTANPLGTTDCTDLSDLGLNSNGFRKQYIGNGCNLETNSLRIQGGREREGRQNDEDNEELPELALPILQIIGSALAGNASALIDNSIALIPSEITSIISNSLNVLVNTINSARPSPATEKSATTATVTGGSTASATPTETMEEDEDYNEATTEQILRTNSSSVTNATTPSSITSAKFISTVAASPTAIVPPTANLSDSETKQTDRTNASATMKEVSDNMAMMLLSLEASLDADNKANWLPLIMPVENISQPMFASMLENMQQPSDDIDIDNKANWASIFNTDAPSPTSRTSERPQKQPYGGNRENGRNPGTILSQSLGSNAQLLQAVSLTRNTTDSKPIGSLKDQLTSILGMNKPFVFNYSANFANAIKTIDNLQTFIATTSPPLSLSNSLGELGGNKSFLNGTSAELIQNVLKITMATSGKTGSTSNPDDYEGLNSFEITTTPKNNRSPSNESSTVSSSVNPGSNTTEDDEDEDEDEDNSDNTEE